MKAPTSARLQGDLPRAARRASAKYGRRVCGSWLQPRHERGPVKSSAGALAPGIRAYAVRLAHAVTSWQLTLATLLLLLPALAAAAPRVERLAPDLYAYVSDNDHSSNATFLIGRHGILVVDTGLNTIEGKKLLKEIRK